MGINADVTVNHGSRSGKYSLAGMGPDEAVQAIKEDLGWAVDGLDFTVNGQRGSDLPEGYELKSGDTLTFLARAGNKGV